MTKQYPTAAFAQASIVPTFTSTHARANAEAEIGELGTLHSCNCNCQINPGQDAETWAWWQNLRATSRPTPGGNWTEDYTLASNSWVD
jgi:predicted dehydrogenase